MGLAVVLVNERGSQFRFCVLCDVRWEACPCELCQRTNNSKIGVHLKESCFTGMLCGVDVC